MPRRNMVAIFLVATISLVCYLRVDHNPYGRYLSQVLTAIEQEALEPPPPHELFNGAMEGIVGKLDRYSGYIRASDADRFQAELDQEFDGVGVTIKQWPVDADKPDGPKKLIVVNPPLAGSPAQRAGIEVGDRIAKIDGQSVAEMSMDEIMNLMRGPLGDSVALSVRRRGRTEPIDLELTRAVLDLPSVMGDRPLRDGGWDFRLRQNSRIGYVRIASFGAKTPDELAAALNALDEQNFGGLILDLRDNPGGLLDAAVATCDMFLPGGLTIVSIKGRGGELERKYVSTGRGRWQDIPLAILVNHYSASASEIVSACLQDHRRAVIVGARTWGKGTVQHVLPIEGGESLLKLTAASYWRPSGRNIHRMKDDGEDDAWGVTPSPGMKVELTDEQANRLRASRAERDILWRPPTKTPDEETTPADPQLQKAVEYLEARLDGNG